MNVLIIEDEKGLALEVDEFLRPRGFYNRTCPYKTVGRRKDLC